MGRKRRCFWEKLGWGQEMQVRDGERQEFHLVRLVSGNLPPSEGKHRRPASRGMGVGWGWTEQRLGLVARMIPSRRDGPPGPSLNFVSAGPLTHRVFAFAPLFGDAAYGVSFQCLAPDLASPSPPPRGATQSSANSAHQHSPTFQTTSVRQPPSPGYKKASFLLCRGAQGAPVSSLPACRGLLSGVSDKSGEEMSQTPGERSCQKTWAFSHAITYSSPSVEMVWGPVRVDYARCRGSSEGPR